NVAVFPVAAQEEPQEEQRKKDNDGLRKRRGIWHFKLKVAGRWKEMSTHETTIRKLASTETRLCMRRRKADCRRIAPSGRLLRPLTIGFRLEKRLSRTEPGALTSNASNVFGRSSPTSVLAQITSADISNYQIQRLEKISAATINSETKVL